MNRLLLILLLCFLTACGYSVAGMGSAPRYTYYIADMSNHSVDLTVTTDMRTQVTRYFYDYGSLKSYDEAAYILRITLEEKNIDASTTSTTREATASSLSVVYRFIVENKEGKTLFDRRMRSYDTFTTGSTVTTFNKNLNDTFAELTDEILSGFKYAFER